MSVIPPNKWADSGIYSMGLRNRKSVYCPSCEIHTEQEPLARGERLCGACGNVFTLDESRKAEQHRNEREKVVIDASGTDGPIGPHEPPADYGDDGLAGCPICKKLFCVYEPNPMAS